MEFESFIQSVAQQKKPGNLSRQLEALWYDGIGDWQKAHDLADGPSDRLSARVHAYLHRKEGDLWNADYWYKRAGEARPSCSLNEEWELLVKRMLEM
ncbi:hypothetical protein [Cecembia calidifontis]|jgi:hypothetical protein|uniref:Uncharacterized protein n=1 Tax=Cecembia calidifontis TaxID=1187080 RepID=A0A4Q7PBF6_9BACT|nr:hypothetical protein [Cecembia calidifontis]RZS97626.1 hypothetical protein BC751_3241 [Cecembia calidifontis]